MSKEKQTILIVDDVPENLAVLFEVLSGAGFEVLVCESGVAALDRLEVFAPDLILLDVVMTELDGIEVCKRVKASPDFGDIPVIFMTALSETVDKVAGFQAGAVDYVSKPFESEEVLARVKAQLDLRRLQRELEARNEILATEVQRRRIAERQLEESLDQAILVVSRKGRIHFCTRRGWDLLGRYFDGSEDGALPAEVLDWLEERAGEPLEIRSGEACLHVRSFMDRASSWDTLMLSLEEKLPIASPEPLQSLGLTPREAEVLFWLTQGKTSPEVAVILDVALNTVKKHAQNIFLKLEVDNRTAAAMKAWEALR